MSFMQPIFSIKNIYKDGLKYKRICFLGIKITIKFKMNNINYKYIETKLKKKIANKQKINIVFMVNIVSMFPARPLFEYLLKNSTNYNPKILIIPDFRFGNKNAIKYQQSAYEELVKAYGENNVIVVSTERHADKINLKEIADIIIPALPYNVSYPKYNLNNLIKLNILTGLINYGYFRSKYDRHLISSVSYSKYWKIFIENNKNLLEYKKYQGINGKNCVVTGYCKMDNYKFFEKQNVINNKKVIMIAPHHSIPGGYNDMLSLSNFLKYSNLFLKLPNMYPNLNFIFRPHPALFICLERDEFWGKEKVAKYISSMKNNSNVRYSDSGDYLYDFAESDYLIQDCGSFLVDYFYTKKPQCYMLKNKEQIETTFSDFGKSCLENVYQAFNEEEIIKFIDNVVIKEKDTMKDKREQFAISEVMVNYPNVSAEICKYLDRTFGVEK